MYSTGMYLPKHVYEDHNYLAKLASHDHSITNDQ